MLAEYQASRQALALRVATLLAVVFNVVFNFVESDLDLPGRSIVDITNLHPTLFRPAGFAFGIWGLIYASFLAYCGVQLLPAQRKTQVYERINPYLIGANLLCSLWIVVFRMNQVALACALIAATLGLAIFMFLKAHQSAEVRETSAWLTVPFSLFLGWISVATIANASIALLAHGYRGEPIGAEAFAVTMVGMAAVLAIFLTLRFRDFVVPAVVSWATFAIYVQLHGWNEIVATSAMIASVACIVASLETLTLRYSRKDFARPNRLFARLKHRAS